MEKGNRDEQNGSNPHSNGDDFSRSLIFFFEKIIFKINKIDEINIKNINKIIKFKII